MTFPHCDQRILHEPGECAWCDMHGDWQELRQAWGIAFTGHIPDENSDILICPADYARPPQVHQIWGGNRPKKKP